MIIRYSLLISTGILFETELTNGERLLLRVEWFNFPSISVKKIQIWLCFWQHQMNGYSAQFMHIAYESTRCICWVELSEWMCWNDQNHMFNIEYARYHNVRSPAMFSSHMSTYAAKCAMTRHKKAANKWTSLWLAMFKRWNNYRWPTILLFFLVLFWLSFRFVLWNTSYASVKYEYSMQRRIINLFSIFQ